ncbi:MAG: hypothetical protein ACTHYJ_11710 [Brevibacterium yomogidense]|uniref:hypothetical protein n=1 Tax=Brevibacterium sp. Mu109 TaxID=1255669 RepID=UPI000C450DF6|nr:hypothetical protein [Brevibacterium sp. Mu109]SMX79376.1 hypothetical protein BSP109_01530 [Brevibacterium sp. Mu109]
MTAAEVRAAEPARAPSVAWPVRVTQDRAVAWLRRRVPGVADASAQLYHHPMLATSYEVRRRDGSASAHALVDLVGGRAYATDPWEHIDFVAITAAEDGAEHGAGGAPAAVDAAPAGGVDDRTGASGTAGVPDSSGGNPSDRAGASAGSISAPRRVLDDEQGERAARDLVRSVLLRGRRLGAPGRLHPLREPLLFGKPNWWLTGTKEGRPVEIILDGLTGRHYALKA